MKIKINKLLLIAIFISNTYALDRVQSSFKELVGSDVISLENNLKDKIVYTFGANKNGNDLWEITFDPNIKGNAFKFPHAHDAINDYSAWTDNNITTKILNSNGDYIELKMYIADTGNYTVTNNNTNDVTIFSGEKRWQINSSVGSVNYDMQKGVYSNDLGVMTDNVYEFYFKDPSTNAFNCPSNPYQDLGGDIAPNYFSTIDTCNTACFKQNSCVELKKTGCDIVDIQYLNPVTDYTGKTLYTTRKLVYECNTTREEQVGCAKWKISKKDGTISYADTPIATSWNENTGGNEAGVLVSLMEQPMHLFSGWKGYCEYGLVWENPFSDPMVLLSYAMMTFNAAGKGALGDSLKSGVDSVKNTFDSAATHLSDQLSDLLSSPDKLHGDMLLKGTVMATEESRTSFLLSLKKFYTITEISVFGKDVALYYTDLAVIAIAGLTSDDAEQSNKFVQTWLGDEYDADEASLAYTRCMASIGLSFPNLASQAIGDINNSSEALQRVYENPIRLTESQIGSLAAATSPKYMATAFKVIDKTSEIYTYIAATPSAYYQAGQVICAGKLAITNNIAMDTSDDSGGGVDTGAMATAAARQAISKLPAPYNIAATLAFDIIVSFSDGDACHDIDIATQWGLIQMKTNRFLNFDQCHKTGTDCVWETFAGECLRHSDKYCCYDQILTRIFAEAIKIQMNKGWESCNDITINDFKDLSFRECSINEDPYEDHCFPRDKYGEFLDYLTKQGIKNVDMESAAKQLKNSISIPNSSCDNQ